MKKTSLALTITSLLLLLQNSGKADDSSLVPPESPSSKSVGLTQSDLESIKSDLRAILYDDRLAHALRISFHDCVGEAGCDGCVNSNDIRNAGPMLNTLAILDRFFDALGYGGNNGFSRADFYSLAGIVAVEIGIDNNNRDCLAGVIDSCQFIFKPKFEFKYGRQDCPTSPFTTAMDPFPEGHSNHSETIDFFSSTFGLDVGEAVALLGGGHTLGGAHANGTGFLGLFKGGVAESRRFNNKYFKLLLKPNIDYKLVNKQNVTNFTRERWQWDGYRNNQLFNFMLNTDISLVYNITTLPSGMSSCQLNQSTTSCKEVTTDNSAAFVQQFSEDVTGFLAKFAKAYVKMINTVKNANELKKPECG